MELRVTIRSQVFCYVNLPRQFDDNIAVLITISPETKCVISSQRVYRLLIEDFLYSSIGVILPQQELEPGSNLVQFCIVVESFWQTPWVCDD